MAGGWGALRLRDLAVQSFLRHPQRPQPLLREGPQRRQCFLPGGVRNIPASREAPEGTDRPTSAGSSVLSSAADPPRMTHVPPRHGTCWAGSSKLISHRRELWGPQGCCPSARTSMVSSRPCQVPAHPSFHWTVSTILRKRFCWASLPNQDRKVITTGRRSLSLQVAQVERLSSHVWHCWLMTYRY